MNMKSDNVAEYLQNNPDFFNQHAELLTELVIPHPYGGRTVSLSERQMLMLRERVKELEKKLVGWMEIAKDNDALQSKVHQYTLEIVGVRDAEVLLDIATRKLCEIFSIPHALIHLWNREGLRPARNLRQPGCHRDPERAPVQRDQGGAGAADRQRRNPQDHREFTIGRAAGFRCHRPQFGRSLQWPFRQRVPV